MKNISEIINELLHLDFVRLWLIIECEEAQKMPYLHVCWKKFRNVKSL
jgi:hypothetical protein